jgi:tRNA-dihydrouridine synthase B
VIAKRIRPLTLGSLQLPVNVLFAPLAGCSDFPYRALCRRFHNGLLFCEMVKMEAILRSDTTSFRMLHYSADMHPIGAQLCGSHPENAAAAAKIIEDMGFDVVDLNCGCPVDKVIDDGSGSGLLRTPRIIGDIIANMVSAVRIPVTLKVRVGWDDQHIIIEDLVHIAESAGAVSMTVHGRTRKQAYTGQANRAWIKAAKQQARTIKIIGNGDIFSAQSALEMLQETGCDGVMIARGGMGQPWLADDIHQLDTNGVVPVRSSAERLEVFLRHFEETMAYGDDQQALVDMRRVGCTYLGRLRGGRAVREAFSTASSLQHMKELITATSWES